MPKPPNQPPAVNTPRDDTATHAGESLPPTEVPAGAAFAAADRPGELGTFGRYRVLKKLGQGGMGAVYLGHDAALDRKVALKVVLPTHAANADARERFLREARTAAMVRSDHVVTVFDVGEEDGIPFIAMEYLLGFPLDRYLKEKGGLPLPQVLRVCRETALGLAAAHAIGLIHRDVKPANLWLEAPKGRVKLLDFGLARVENDDTELTGTGAVVGTPAYMSPEQGRGLKVDFRTDLFSLGVVMYQLTTGRLPFAGSSTMAILTSLAIDSPVAPRQIRPDIPEELEAIIGRLLAKNPDGRFQSAQEVADAIRAVEQPGLGLRPVVVPAESLVVGLRSQNVWEAIADTETDADPVPMAAPADATEAEPEAPRPPRPARKQPERPVSKLPLILAGVGLLAAVGILVAVLSPSRPSVGKGEPDPADGGAKKQDPPRPGFKSGSQPPVTQPNPPQPPQPPNPAADRTAAGTVISLGGFVRLAGNPRPLRDVAALPNGAFTLDYVYVNGGAAPRPIDDGLLAPFKDCKELTGLVLISCVVTDTGLANFNGCTRLKELALYGPKVGDAGVANFKGCDALENLYLHGTAVTDTGLAAFKDCKSLTSLRLANLKVGAAGLGLFRDCTKLETLALDQTVANAADLAIFSGCTAIKDLDLSGAPVGNDALPHFKGCTGLVAVNVSGTRIDDAGLAFFKDSATLRELNLSGTGVTGDGLASLAGCGRLGVLRLGGLKLGDDSLSHLRACADLYSLDLQKTPIGDAALKHVEGFAGLQVLQLRGTKVSTDAARKLAEKLPDCRVEWDGGTIEPKNDPDRRAAEWIMQNGSIANIFVNGKEVLGATPETLPRERFELRSLNVNRNKAVNDETLAGLNGARHLVSAQITNVSITDKTLTYLKDCKKLETLILYATGVTDEGLKTLAGLKALRYLDITQLNLSEGAVQQLAEALPKCRIRWGRDLVIEPKQ